MVVDAKGDPSNTLYIDKGQKIPASRLVPFDNNIALRCICRQCNPDYSNLALKEPCCKERDENGQC
jgi:hypothetical protein